MISARWLKRVLVSVLLAGMWTASAQGQFYGGGWYGQAGIPYGYPSYAYPYSQIGPNPYDYYGAGYPSGFPYDVPPPLRYLAPSYSYNPNPYAPFPGAASYELPFGSYNPNSYTYDLRAYGYGLGYPPPAYAYPAYPVFPYSYFTPSGHYIGPLPYHWRGPYHAMTLQQYIAKQLQGPTRVRDVAPGIP